MPDRDQYTVNDFDLSPQEFRRLGESVLDLMAESLAAERVDPLLQSIGGSDLGRLLDEPLPRTGCHPDQALQICRDVILRHNRRNGHPAFFAYVCASADPIGVLADALASAMNQNVTAWRSAPAAAEIESRVIAWLDELVGFDGTGHGLLVGGGSAANFTALAAAILRVERSHSEFPNVSRETMTIYLSQEAHLSLSKAARVLGIKPPHIRHVAVDAQRRLDVTDLDQQLQADRAAGLVAVCICASAGTANTGAIDPLDAIAQRCVEQKIWCHVDGAYGAPAAMTADYAWMKRAFARADSLSLDPHKWLFAPLDAGCILFRDPVASAQAFSAQTEYTAVTQTDPVEGFAFFDHGLELSRRFRALKVWMILKVRGADRLAAAIQRNIDLRRYLDQRIAAEPNLEPLGSELSIACFRYRPPYVQPDMDLNELNHRILESVIERGRVFMSPTRLEGRFALRACIVNFRTQRQHIDLLLDEVLQAGRQLTLAT